MISTDFPFLSDWWQNHDADFDVILFDIDGTLIHGRHELPGAKAFLSHLQNTDFPYLLLTNDANHSQLEKAEILAHRGIHVPPEEIFSAGNPLKSYAEQENLIGTEAFILGDLGIPCYAENAGFQTTRSLERLSTVRSIIIGEGEYDWYTRITAVVNAIRKNPAIRLLSPNPDTYWPSGKSEIGIGAGGVARFISDLLRDNGLDVPPIYLGKPYRPIFDAISVNINSRLKRAVPPERILMIGDSLQSDIRGARAAGFTAGLVLTGITTLRLLQNAPEQDRPHYVFNAVSKENIK